MGGRAGAGADAVERDAGLPPPHAHVPRPRLIDRLHHARVGLVVGGGGWGKTSLALELARAVGSRTAILRLEPGLEDAAGLRASLRRALRRAGLSDLVHVLDEAGDPVAALDALVDSLARDETPVLLVADEIEHLGGTALEAATRLAVDLPAPHRLLLVGRALSGAMRDALEGGAVEVSTAELAFTAEETARLAGALGLALTEGQAGQLAAATDGWAAAIVVAVERLRATDGLDAGLADLGALASGIGDLIRAQLVTLDPELVEALVQLAHVVPLPAGAVGRVAGRDGVVAACVRAGIPIELRRDGWVALSAPVRETLVQAAPLRPATARAAAAVHEALGEVAEGVRLLVRAGDPEAAADLLDRLTPIQAGRLDFHELNAVVASVGRAVRTRPRALLHLARACEAAAEARARREALELAAAAGGDAALRREIEAECARDLVRDGKVDEAEALASRLLEEAAPEETQTRVRALHVLGRTHAWRGDLVSLAAAEPRLLEAAELYLALGNPVGHAHALLGLAYDVYTLGGRSEEAVACLERATAVLPWRSRLRGVLLDFRGEALADLGRDDEAEASLLEADRVGRLLGDARTVAYAAWVRARIAARRRDAPAVRALLDVADRSRGDWYEHHSGVEFLAEAASLAYEVGLEDAAAAYLERARARRGEAPRYVLLAEGAIAARRGDPAADALLAQALALPDLEARVRWRAALLRAWAVHRAGDRGRADELAAAALAEAAALGQPELPFLWEREIAGTLLTPAAAPEQGAATVRVRVLGGFAVERGAAEVELPPGRPARLVALLAAHDGRLPTDRVIEALWPEVEPESGRKRLRNVLNRLRETAGELVVRADSTLALAPGVEVDAARFRREAERALAVEDAVEAEGPVLIALAAYAGDLLPDHRYEDWAAGPRERLRALALRLVDRAAAAAEQAGELDDAVRRLERGIELDPLDESRYLRAARVLLTQGRRGRALDVLRQAAATLRGLGIEPSDEHRALVRSTRS